MAEVTIDILHELGLLTELDYRFARFIGKMDGRNAPEVQLAAATVSTKRREGHICIDLDAFAEQAVTPSQVNAFAYPPLNEWVEILEQSKTIGCPGQYRPLILDGNLLYLYRYWEYEKNLSKKLNRMTSDISDIEDADLAHLQPVLAEIFPEEGRGKASGIDQLKTAALTALRKRLCVITGGPGTGKTYTIAKILALLIEQNAGKDYKIALAAPTGKAAGRLKESVIAVKAQLRCPDDVKKHIPEEASTIHRLLGSIPNSPYFRHNRENRLSADCVVIDEASMIDLALFSKLVDALRSDARLILLGDKDQLASVEAGAVLGDICDAGCDHGFSRPLVDAHHQSMEDTMKPETSAADRRGMADCIVELTKSFRFTEASGIRALSRAVNAGNTGRTLDIINKEDYSDLAWKELPVPDRLSRLLEDWIIEKYRPGLSVADPASALEMQGRARILCALRDGPYGVHAINTMVERILVKEGLIRRAGKWYPGRPVMITRNDYNLGLFNGDVGIAMIDGESGILKVFFLGPDGSLRGLPPARLPDHETVFAMTVHKSQGSEFNDVLFILTDRDTPILTRELIYTAITRARNRIEIWGKKDLLLTAVGRRIQRSSGLRRLLWG
jgi:exodeoxyribonuclease V alpha subunit